MGWRRELGCPWWIHADNMGHSEQVGRWSPSTDISAAWLVVEKMLSESWMMEMTGSEFIEEAVKGFDVYFNCKVQALGHFHANGATAPHAICPAALKAVGYKFPDRREAR